MAVIHGGDIYRNHVDLDFSVNVNPLGVPEAVEAAIGEAVGLCNRYPDIKAEKLRKAVSTMLTVPPEYLLFGNGASELLMAVVHGINPQKVLIPVPSFYGYEYAAKAADREIVYYETKQKDGFCVTDELYQVLTEGVDLLFLANPGNPAGNLLSREEVSRLLGYCRDQGIYVVIDECFIEFCGQEFSILPDVGRFDNLILIRAFTKIFSIPGVRLGYLVSSNRKALVRIGRQLPEWNLSCFAQEAGCACALQTEFIAETEAYVKKERHFLERKLEQKGIRVFPSQSNFILVYSDKPLYEQLLKKGILIRDCRNFKGLCPGYYRIAVRLREENEILAKKIGEIESEKNRASSSGGN